MLAADETSNRPDQPSIEVVQADSYLYTLIVSVPADTMWQPHQATQLMANLFMISDLKLQISAETNQITWGIEVPLYAVEIIKKAIHAQYPTAQIRIEPKTTTCIGYRLYHFEIVQPFVCPLKQAADFNQADSLATLTGMIAGLSLAEHLVYELTIASPTEDYRALGEELITESVVNWTDFLTLEGALSASMAKAQSADRVDKYRPEDQEILREKLSQTLADIQLAVKVKAATEERALELFVALSLGLEPMANEPFNWLYPAEEQTYPLVLSPEEAAALWHLPTQGCQAPGIVWTDQAPASFEMYGLPDDFYTAPAGDAPGQNPGSLEDLEEMIFGELDDDDDLPESDRLAKS
jgi:hypothetical protein